jgi:hypothetical protein
MQEVMATGEENITKLDANVNGGASASGPKPPPPPSRLDEARAKLSTPLTHGADPATIEADLEAHRVLLLKQAEEVAATKRQLEITRREYDRAHGFTLAGNNPSRAGMIRRRGGGLGAEIDRDGAESPAASMELPVHNTPKKNMRVAEAIAEELSSLEGEELRRQTRRITELLHVAAEQQKNQRYASNAPSSSLAHDAAGRTREGRHRHTRAGTAVPSEDPMPAQAIEAGAQSPLPQAAGPAEAGRLPAGSSRNTPPTSRHANARTGRLRPQAAHASRLIPGWASVSGQWMPETASTGS